MLFDDFKPIVELVLNNWTALQLAVQHGMGAPGGKETAQLMAVYVTRYCVENGVVEREDLTEVLEDLMDEEFETVCHDDSPKEVASLLIHLVGLLREGRRDELTDQLNRMPKCELWLCQPEKTAKVTLHGNPNDYTSSSESDDDDETDRPSVNANNMNDSANDASGHNGESSSDQPEPMDQDSDPDPGWTVVRSRKKK